MIRGSVKSSAQHPEIYQELRAIHNALDRALKLAQEKNRILERIEDTLARLADAMEKDR